MSQEIKGLHFKHTLASGREIRLSVYRKANTKPRVVADSVKEFNQEEIREYLAWREKIVAIIMASLTQEEAIQSAAHGYEALKKEAAR